MRDLEQRPGTFDADDPERGLARFLEKLAEEEQGDERAAGDGSDGAS